MNRYSRMLLFILCMGSGLRGAPSHATTLVAMDLKELVTTSDFVFRGRVVEVSSAVDEWNLPWTTFTFSEVEPIAGETQGSEFSLHCAGGKRPNGTTHEFVGTPKFRPGDDAIVFFREDSRMCQVLGWEQGAFFVLRSATGEEVVMSSAGRPIIAVDASGLVFGKRPDWLVDVSPEAARFAEYASHIVGQPDTPERANAQPSTARAVVDALRTFSLAQGVPHRKVPPSRAATGHLPPITGPALPVSQGAQP